MWTKSHVFPTTNNSTNSPHLDVINSEGRPYSYGFQEIILDFLVSGMEASFFSGRRYAWLVKVLGQFSFIYFRGLGLRIGVRVWVRDRVRVRVSVVLWSG